MKELIFILMESINDKFGDVPSPVLALALIVQDAFLTFGNAVQSLAAKIQIKAGEYIAAFSKLALAAIPVASIINNVFPRKDSMGILLHMLLVVGVFAVIGGIFQASGKFFSEVADKLKNHTEYSLKNEVLIFLGKLSVIEGNIIMDVVASSGATVLFAAIGTGINYNSLSPIVKFIVCAVIAGISLQSLGETIQREFPSNDTNNTKQKQ